MTDFDFAKEKIHHELIVWFVENGRELPWRRTSDAYKIWLSEVILQQTRVDQGLPYYNTFVKEFPDVHQLAKASMDRILRLWQGLGYYSRARHLHACAKIIVEKYNAKFPSNKQELIGLPGIGDYTAAAIASFAFGKKEAVVDGNVIRVITRLFGIDADVRLTTTQNNVKELAIRLLPDRDNAKYNQAIMEFGALLCTPKSPDCANCPLAELCTSFKEHKTTVIPFKSRAKPARIRYFNYLVPEYQGRWLMVKRMQNDIWKYLHEFPLIETSTEQNFAELDIPGFLANISEVWLVADEAGPYMHILSHQKIIARFFLIRMLKLPDNPKFPWKNDDFLTPEKIENLAKPVLISRYIADKKNHPIEKTFL